MRSRSRVLASLLVALAAPSLLGFAACATVDPRPDYAEARRQIQEATGRTAVFDPEAPAMTEAGIEAVLAGGLTLDEALRLALLNNRRLQAGFARLGVARAELLQAGLLGNPSLGMAFLFPSGGGSPKVTVDLIENVLGIWELPARKRIASAELAREVLEVSRFAGELVAETQTAYFESVGARDLRTVAGGGAEIARSQLEVVRQRVQGGVATETEASLAQSAALVAELDLQRAEREEATAKRRLAALLSLEEDLREIELTDAVPPPLAAREDREAFVVRSLDRRLDLRAAAAALAAAAAQAAFEARRVVPKLEAGLSAERPERGADPDLLFGPGATVELPLFDQNRVRASRAEFRRRGLEKEYEALRSEIAQSVRAAADRAATAARTAAFVAEELLPQAERTVELMQSAYELGDTTLLPLLESRRAALAARRGLVEALTEAARARVDLERQIGAPLEEGRDLAR